MANNFETEYLSKTFKKYLCPLQTVKNNYFFNLYAFLKDMIVSKSKNQNVSKFYIL